MRQALSAVLLYTVDQATDEGTLLTGEHSVRAYPTFVLMNGRGETMESWVGYSKSDFLDMLSKALADRTTIEEKRARFAQDPTSDLAAKLAGYHAARSEYGKAVQYYRAADRLNQDPDTNYLNLVLRCVFYGLRDSTFTRDSLRQVADSLFASSRSKTKDLLTAGHTMVSYLRSYQDTTLAVPYIAAAIERTENVPDPDTTGSRTTLLIDYELFVTKDRAAALDRMRATMPDGWDKDYQQLFSFSSWCVDNQINLEEAKELAVKALTIARRTDKDSRYPQAIRYTLSDLCLALGDTIEASVYRKASQPEGWTEDAASLNSYAWWCFENKVTLGEAESFARRGVALAQPGKEKAQILDTLAEICHARGKSAEALVLIREAIREDSDDPYYRTQLDRFQKIADQKAIAY